jgi:hypothetical protein
MSRIKLKDLLREIQLKEAPVADMPPPEVQIIAPHDARAYNKAASDGAGKPYTQHNIDFTGIGGRESDSLLKSKASNVLKAFENTIKAGYNKKLKKWFPHKSLEGGSDTIAYGHKIQKGEDFSKGITDDEALQLLDKDIDSKIKLSRKLLKNFDGMPLEVKIAVINGMFRGDLSGSPDTLKLLNANKFKEAAREYLNNREYKTTKNSGIKKRMNWNAAVFASAG